MTAPHILIMAGGTGGHVFPAMAVARELSRRGAEVSWLGTRRGLESDVVPAAGYAIDYISVSGLRGKGALGWLLAPLRLSWALCQAMSVMLRRRPAAVLGMGGFVTGPGGVAARLLGRPLLIHEQNAVAGLTNRILSYLAQRVMEAFPSTFKGAVHTGNPVRSEIAALPKPEERYTARAGRLRLLVIGGSLGAVALNEALPQALAQLPEPQRPEVRHQTGKRNFEQAQAAYAAAAVEAELIPFVDDMAQVYGWADIVLCRAGALTVSELAAAGLPSILVPYPYAVDDHQTKNAHYLTDSGAAVLLTQNDLQAEVLANSLGEFCVDAEQGRKRLFEMARHARDLALPAATKTVADLCLQAVKVDGTRGDGQ
ncbi:MAG: undecaprenyldiphospho-muramoylpentapeptide beta-N-acetylglucosaminyltransferase [Gammaproteobacteria bacterium]|nr:undecaprenyldiphospho-muramoylpentapeptide beta-N-acetylglucosaminyltransferase [Gammaproteobacteria bacterium]